MIHERIRVIFRVFENHSMRQDHTGCVQFFRLAVIRADDLTLTVKSCSRTNAMEYDTRIKGASITFQKQQATCQGREGLAIPKRLVPEGSLIVRTEMTVVCPGGH